MRVRKPMVDLSCVANQYSAYGERIIEVTNGLPTESEHKGALISLRAMEDGTFTIHVYRRDPGVAVTTGTEPHAPRWVAKVNGETFAVADDWQHAYGILRSMFEGPLFRVLAGSGTATAGLATLQSAAVPGEWIRVSINDISYSIEPA